MGCLQSESRGQKSGIVRNGDPVPSGNAAGFGFGLECDSTHI